MVSRSADGAAQTLDPNVASQGVHRITHNAEDHQPESSSSRGGREEGVEREALVAAGSERGQGGGVGGRRSPLAFLFDGPGTGAGTDSATTWSLSKHSLPSRENADSLMDFYHEKSTSLLSLT
jgi:hypothetical protein